MSKIFSKIILLVALLIVFFIGKQVSAATMLSNISESNNQGTSIFRSNIWVGYKFTAGASATISSVTLDLDHTAGNYTGFSTYTSGVIKFYNDNAGVVGTVISGTLTYTSTNTGTGVTVYGTASGGTITLPSSGNYWMALTCASCANIDYQESSSTGYSGSSGWATVISASGISTSNNSGSTWGTPYSSITYGAVMFTINGALADSTAPTITNVSSDKVNGSYTVGEVIDIDVTFSEAVTSTGNVTVTLETGTADRTCTFTVTSTTTGTCNYTVQAGDESSDLTVSSISGTIADSAANSMSNFVPATNLAANKAIVIDTTAPTITNISSDKVNGSYTVGEVIDIDVTFSEAVTSTGNVTVTLETGTADRTCTFTVTSTTTGTCNYTVQAGDTTSDLTVNTISGTIADAATNAMTNFVPTTNLAANKALVIDTTAPTVQTLSPADDAVSISSTANLVITFTEAVNPGSGNVVIKNTSDDSTVETIPVGSGLVTGGGTIVITIDPSTVLSSGVGYYVTIASTAFVDAATNAYSGISNSATWNFTTLRNSRIAIVPVYSVAIKNPIGKEKFEVGKIVPIDWNVSSNGGYSINLDLSTNGGVIFDFPIVSAYSSAPPFNWTVPNIITPESRIRVQVIANGAVAASAQNVENFSIIENNFVKLTTQQNNEVLRPGVTTTVSWETTKSINPQTVRVFLSTNGGKSYPTRLLYDVPNIGQLNWKLPLRFRTTTQARIKIQVLESGIIKYQTVSPLFRVQK